MKHSKRVEDVLEKAKRDFEVVWEIIEEREYVQITGSYCGDIRCYRYYNNGMVTER